MQGLSGSVRVMEVRRGGEVLPVDSDGNHCYHLRRNSDYIFNFPSPYYFAFVRRKPRRIGGFYESKGRQPNNGPCEVPASWGYTYDQVLVFLDGYLNPIYLDWKG
jgi:hypothetical protein